ncbi:hypothetical protein PXH67_06525 [Streptomyces sp. P8-A8]|uniref:hypothetical protein n=1 Tax=Streptomyces sp. P8-A8 TaxID=3029759 RepID=UPI0036D7752C
MRNWIRSVPFWRRWRREKDQDGDTDSPRDAVCSLDFTVLTLAGQQVPYQRVMAETNRFGELSDAVRGSATRVIHRPSEDLRVTQGITDVQ